MVTLSCQKVCWKNYVLPGSVGNDALFGNALKHAEHPGVKAGGEVWLADVADAVVEANDGYSMEDCVVNLLHKGALVAALRCKNQLNEMQMQKQLNHVESKVNGMRGEVDNLKQRVEHMEMTNVSSHIAADATGQLTRIIAACYHKYNVLQEMRQVFQCTS